MRSGGPLVLRGEYEDRPADIQIQHPSGSDPYVREDAKFVAAVRGEAPPAATGEEGVAALKLIDAIYRSAAEGREVTIE